MPYIQLESKEGARLDPQCAGELNYAITCLVIDYITEHSLRYQTLNDVLAAFVYRQNYNFAKGFPVITEEQHEALLKEMETPISDCHELGSRIFALCIFYYNKYYYVDIPKETGEQIIRDIAGAVEGAKLEFYRRIVAPYEDKKIKENGDVY